MIFNVMLVEDEPAAMRHLRSTIEKKCPGFRVSETAEDGWEACEKIEADPPDLIITDIRMPRISGLELAEQVKKNHPEIQTIILSGYQEFDYARKALQHEVVDYILKPINIPELEQRMEDLHKQMSQKSYWNTHKIIQNYLSAKGSESMGEEGEKRFRTAVIRINGLHPKFHKKVCYNPPEPVIKLLNDLLKPDEKESLFLFTGRDNNEFYFLCPKDDLHYSRFREITEEFSSSLPFCKYYTSVLSLDFPLKSLSEVLDRLYILLRENTLLGKSRILYDQTQEQISRTTAGLGSVFFRNADFLSKTKALDKMRTPLQEWLRECRRHNVPLIEIELEFSHLLNHLLGSCTENNTLRIESGILMDRVSQNIGDYESLLDNFMKIIDLIQNETHQSPQVLGCRESFTHITEYIQNNLTEDLSVPDLCSQFCISQSYLNKLFHKFEKMSVVEFIRLKRVNASIEIMKKSPDIPLKEISRIVGYEDSSYFSRVFKNHTGYSPRQYLDKEN